MLFEEPTHNSGPLGLRGRSSSGSGSEIHTSQQNKPRFSFCLILTLAHGGEVGVLLVGVLSVDFPVDFLFN